VIAARLVLCVAILLLNVYGTATAQSADRAAVDSSIAAARTHYYAAAYEDALEALERIQPPRAADAAVVEQYRGASLLALGRVADAEAAFERMVRVAPDLTADTLGFAPRVNALIAAVRARVLPLLEHVPDPGSVPALVAPQQAPPFYTAADPDVTRPVAIQESVPEPPSIADIDFTGTVFVEIDIAPDGTVERAALRGAIHPTYDAMIAAAAREWRYRPASVGAEPVKFRKVLKIQVS
jgi:tetratricopeptide (TPR) repeat protein